MVGAQSEDSHVGVDHHHLQLEVIAVDGDHLQVECDFLVHRVGRQRFAALLQQLEQRVPLLGLGVKTAQGGHRLRQPRLEAPECLPGVDGLFQQLRPSLGQLGHLNAVAHAGFGVGFGLLGLAQEREQLGDLVARQVIFAVEVEHRRNRGHGFASPTEARLGLGDLAQALPVQLAQSDQDRSLADPAFGRAQSRLIDSHQLGPSLACGQNAYHTVERALVAGKGGQSLAVVVQGLVSAVVLLGQTRGGRSGRGKVLGAARGHNAPLEVLGQLLPAAGPAEQTF